MKTVIGNGEPFYLTQNKVWDREEVYEYFSDKITDDNLKILFDHICVEGLAEHIFSIVEIENTIYLNLGDGEGLLKVEYNK